MVLVMTIKPRPLIRNCHRPHVAPVPIPHYESQLSCRPSDQSLQEVDRLSLNLNGRINILVTAIHTINWIRIDIFQNKM